MFWIGFGIGAILGALFGIMCIALVATNCRYEEDNNKHDSRFANQNDRNEF